MNSTIRYASFLTLTLLILVCAPLTPGLADDVEPKTNVLLVVNRRPITETDLEFLYVSRQVPQDVKASVREKYLEELVDRTLMREFLTDRKLKRAKFCFDGKSSESGILSAATVASRSKCLPNWVTMRRNSGNICRCRWPGIDM